MKIIENSITLIELNNVAEKGYGTMVKAVIDVKKEIIAIDAELHSDLEALCLDQGSKQNDLCGINYYPKLEKEEFIEFDSMINLRPAQGDTSRFIEDDFI